MGDENWDILEKAANVQINDFPKTLKFGEVFNRGVACKVSEVTVSSNHGNMTYNY